VDVPGSLAPFFVSVATCWCLLPLSFAGEDEQASLALILVLSRAPKKVVIALTASLNPVSGAVFSLLSFCIPL